MLHKNIPNNNKDIIRFLAKNFAGTKKVRNSILFCSVVIGIVAITMVFGISFGKIQAEEIRLIRENGAASSGIIEDGTEEQYAKLKQLDYIKQVGKSIFVGEATDISKNNEKTICNVVWADSESWNNFLRPAYTNVIGNYPQKKEEILLSERALKKLGISEPEQGMEINLDVYKGVFEHSKEKFELCGWYTDSGNELSIGYISHDKINELSLEKGPYTLLFSQSNHLSRSKTEEKLYVSGINCMPDTALQEMRNTKKQFFKTTGIQCFHGVQSFVKGEVTPEKAHEIGVKLAEEIWGDKFQVVISTHLNTDNLHNHFVLNSVSFLDGKRFCNAKKDYATMRKTSDRLCEYYGLTISQIESKSRTKNIANARHIAVYLCRKHLEMPFVKIGFEFGNRDHSTIMASYEKMVKLLKEKETFQQALLQIENKLGIK